MILQAAVLWAVDGRVHIHVGVRDIPCSAGADASGTAACAYVPRIGEASGSQD